MWFEPSTYFVYVSRRHCADPVAPAAQGVVLQRHSRLQTIVGGSFPRRVQMTKSSSNDALLGR
jgi:hypothetical protein